MRHKMNSMSSACAEAEGSKGCVRAFVHTGASQGAQEARRDPAACLLFCSCNTYVVVSVDIQENNLNKSSLWVMKSPDLGTKASKNVY